MCCSNQHQYPERFNKAMHKAACGCGCIGREKPGWHLESYKAYLKAELESVEEQIQDIRDIRDIRKK